MIRLHHVPLSRSLRVLWMLEELGLSYDIASYSIRDGSLRDPGFLAISPAGRVPALEFDGKTWFESGAILQLLCESHPEAGLMPPPDHPDRPRFLEFLSYGETMASLCENLNLSRVFLRDPAQASPVVIKLLTARLRASVRALEPLISGPYLLDSGFSAADIMVGYTFLLAERYVSLDDLDGIVRYRGNLGARPAYQRALERDGVQDIYDRDFYPLPEA